MLDGFRCNLCVAKKNVKATTNKDGIRLKHEHWVIVMPIA
ncbi:hypothetical protein SORBI_3001G271801 [Sorghum bicolor]|uniref:Uncharacterized protein n=1 Tax=Sorghum bicolor TaxID=4558 RepID=A0A1Z5S8C3_SORBI|nr:hypothetical protein SORBI_3001G271801 [Sorghum bicolor]